MQVLEMGSHEELLSKPEQGAYASLIHLQQARQEDEAFVKHDLETDPQQSEEISLNSRQLSRKSGESPRQSRNSFKLDRKSFETSHSSGHVKAVEASIQRVAAEKKHNVKGPSIRRLIALNRPEWKQGLLGLAGAIGFGFVQPTYAYVLGDMVAKFYTKDFNKLRNDVKIYSSIFVAISVVAFIVNVLQHYNFAALGEYLTKRIRVRMLSNILRFEVGWYDQDENASGAVCSRLVSDASMVCTPDFIHDFLQVEVCFNIV